MRVLCFHDVSDQAWFASILDLLGSTYHVLTPDQFHGKEFVTDTINVLLTFDDGYQSWIDHCLPELEARGIKGIFFINSGLLAMAADDQKTKLFMHDHLLISPKVPLTWDGARKLVAAGHTVGGHTVTHVRLSQITPEVGETEIVADKAKHEAMLGITLLDFAYPFGTPTDRTAAADAAAQHAGYQFVYTTDAAFAAADQPTAIPRLCLERGQPLPSIKRWVDGAYDVASRLW